MFLRFNVSDNQITLNNQKEKNDFEILNDARADTLIEIDPYLISLAKKRSRIDFQGELNQLIQDIHFTKIDTPTSRPHPDYSKLSFLAPETCYDFSKITPLQREIFDQVLQLQGQEKLDPKNNDADKTEILKNFQWDTCVLNADQKGILRNFWLKTMMCLPKIALT